MTRSFTCIICPNGCEITAEYEGDTVYAVRGATCPKGDAYVRQELTDPQRNIATSVLVEGGELPLASVRLSRPISKKDIFRVMEVINTPGACKYAFCKVQLLKGDHDSTHRDIVVDQQVQKARQHHQV